MGWRLGWLAALILVVSIVPNIPCQAGTATGGEPQWRRTRCGWVHVSQMFPPARPTPPPLHPLLLAAGQILISIGALLALQRPDGSQSGRSVATEDTMDTKEFEERNWRMAEEVCTIVTHVDR
jgi:hypothetical protein